MTLTGIPESLSQTKDIQQAICKAEIKKGNHVAENFNYFFAGELDVISVSKSGYVSEFEVKVSRSDFKADAKKRKWQWYENPRLQILSAQCPNYFTYVCLKGLIQESDLKDYQGLIWIIDNEIITIRKPKIIHKHKHDILKLLSKMLTVNNWRHYFGAQKLTILNREAKDRNDENLKEQFKNSIKHLPRYGN